MIGTDFETQAGTYTITACLGKGKAGHTYLIERGTDQRVLKIMHDEEVSFYTFHDDKVQAEVEAYHQLRQFDIAIPELLEYDISRHYLVKSYVDGRMAAALIADGMITEGILAQLFNMAAQLEGAGINIDYFPTNFMLDRQGTLYYIDYETNTYSDAWNLANWGLYYWVNQRGMSLFLKTGDGHHINQGDSGVPIKAGLQEEVERLLAALAVR